MNECEYKGKGREGKVRVSVGFALDIFYFIVKKSC